jgi:citrate lyase subunit beta/citryl-CoA lyase
LKSSTLTSARSVLFVPGDRPERFDKAIRSGADVVVLDLEDSVAPARKSDARQALSDWLTAGGTAVVRINGHETRWHAQDLAMVVEHRAPVMLPKAALVVASAAAGLAAPLDGTDLLV